jgi:3-oxoacyl-[acyl-carrier protein] reductase
LKGGDLNVLINNVGEYSTGDITKFSIQNFESIINTNLLGSYYMIQELHPLFNREGGSIINIGYTGINS